MHFKTVAIIGRYQDTGLDAPLRKLAATIRAAGCSVLLEADTAKNTGITDYTVVDYAQIGRQADLAVIMGGDGTMIGAARQLAASGVALVGINHGRLGFITDIPLHSAADALAEVIHGNFTTEERVMLEGRVTRGNETLFSGLALNDVVINRAGRGGMIEVRVEYDGNFMYSQRADGLIDRLFPVRLGACRRPYGQRHTAGAGRSPDLVQPPYRAAGFRNTEPDGDRLGTGRVWRQRSL
jgi:NAD+ kinase